MPQKKRHLPPYKNSSGPHPPVISMTKPPRRAETGAGSLTAAVGCCSPIDGSLVCSLAQARCCAHLHRWTAVPLPPPPSHICALRAGPFVGPTAALSTPRPATCTPALCASALLALSRGPLPASPFHTPFRYSKSRAPAAWSCLRLAAPRAAPQALPSHLFPIPVHACALRRQGRDKGTRAGGRICPLMPLPFEPAHPHTHIPLVRSGLPHTPLVRYGAALSKHTRRHPVAHRRRNPGVRSAPPTLLYIKRSTDRTAAVG